METRFKKRCQDRTGDFKAMKAVKHGEAGRPRYLRVPGFDSRLAVFICCWTMAGWFSPLPRISAQSPPGKLWDGNHVSAHHQSAATSSPFDTMAALQHDYSSGGTRMNVAASTERDIPGAVEHRVSQTPKSVDPFDDFISPVSNPFFFEDPRNLSEVRAMFLQHKVPLAAGCDSFRFMQARFGSH